MGVRERIKDGSLGWVGLDELNHMDGGMVGRKPKGKCGGISRLFVLGFTRGEKRGPDDLSRSCMLPRGTCVFLRVCMFACLRVCVFACVCWLFLGCVWRLRCDTICAVCGVNGLV